MQTLATFALVILTLSLPTTPGFALPVATSRVAISGPSEIANEAGVAVFEKGGNVVDVAVATALVMAVTTPYYASLGGGGFAMVKSGADKVQVLDFRESAPLKVKPDFFKNLPAKASTQGGKAVAVPGVPAGLWELHKKHGKLHWSELFEAAIRFAEKGFPVTGEWAENTSDNKQNFNPTGLQVFFDKGQSYKPGQILKQPQLATTLKEMRNRGSTSFYKGTIARSIVEAVQKAEGLMSLDDLKNYTPRWVEPITTNYMGSKIHLMPPPSSGGVLIAQGLSLLQQVKAHEQSQFSANEFHLIGEVLKTIFQFRNLLADPTFHKNPIQEILDPKRIQNLANGISVDKTIERKPMDQIEKESTETTHLSVMDNKGNAVAMTLTLNGEYGSGVVTSTGIALNNEMDDFNTHPDKPNMFGLMQGLANKVEPGKRPLSSMSPTLVEKNGKIIMTLGSPGGPRIISAVLQVLYRVLGRQLDMDSAIQAPRVHHQTLPNILYVDRLRISPDTKELLIKKGHTLEEGMIARVYGARSLPSGQLESAFDSRGEGSADGF